MPAEPGVRSWFSPRRIVAIVVMVAVLVAGGVWSNQQANRYYLFSPGMAPVVTTASSCRLSHSGGGLRLPDGVPCARLVVPAGRAHPLSGQLRMVDVLVGPSTPLDYLLAQVHLLGVFDHGSQLVPAAAVLGPTPAPQLNCQDNQQMTGATRTAALVALGRLGYHVGVRHLGAQVDLVLPGSAAARAGVRCNDLITAVDGRPVTNAAALASAVRSLPPGTPARVTVERNGSNGPSQTHVLTATLGPTPALDGAPAQPSVGFLGVATQSRVAYRLPFPVGIDVGNIGGPSAGLALTLGLLDALSGGRLTGGHIVAATGTISPSGAVGDVGGVAQKTVAVERAGASLFLVPPQELAAAEGVAHSHLVVRAVSTLSQALADLASIGGTIPAPAQGQGTAGAAG